MAPESGPESAPDSAPVDAAVDVSDAGPIEEPTPLADGPFPACTGSDPGDGGTRCVAYDVALDGAVQDEAGEPTGLGAVEACTRGQPCTVCLGGSQFAGFCE